VLCGAGASSSCAPFGVLVRLFHSRQILLIENLALRQQLAVVKRQGRRPRLAMLDKLFWVLLYRFWPSWKKTLILVSPDTVVRWHRAGFRLYWQLISRVRKPVGRKPVTKEIRELIFKMVAENPTWRAPRIHGELVMLGFEISERSVSRWMRRASRSPDSAQRWLTFLRNHREAIAAMDFFSVPTVRFGVPYVFFLIGYDRRRILHFNVTHAIRLASGSGSSCAKPFPTNQQPSFSCWITTPSTAPKFRPQFARWISRLCGPPLVVLGRTVLPSAGWEAAAANCWTM
jgi:putative transposase